MFPYLGSQIRSTATLTVEIVTRSARMDRAYKRFAPQHFENPHVGMWQKLLLFNTTVVLNALYACETWDYTPWGDIHRLEEKQVELLDKIMRPTPGTNFTILTAIRITAIRMATCLPNQVPLVWPIYKISEEITTSGADIPILPNYSGEVSPHRCSRGGKGGRGRGGCVNNGFAI